MQAMKLLVSWLHFSGDLLPRPWEVTSDIEGDQAATSIKEVNCAWSGLSLAAFGLEIGTPT